MLYCFAVQLTGFVITLNLHSVVLTICTMREHFSLSTQCVCEFHMITTTHIESPHLQQYLLAFVLGMQLFSMRQELNLNIHYLNERLFQGFSVWCKYCWLALIQCHVTTENGTQPKCHGHSSPHHMACGINRSLH